MNACEALYEHLGVTDAALRAKEQEAVRQGELNAEAWDIITELAMFPYKYAGLAHRAAMLLDKSDPQPEGPACQVHNCDACRDEQAERNEEWEAGR